MKAIIEAAKDQPCVDCGKRYPTCVMEFDHVRGEKKFTVSQINRSTPNSTGLRALEDEIAKCDVRCANCHRLRHYHEDAPA
jgi:hypothetical protein